MQVYESMADNRECRTDKEEISVILSLIMDMGELLLAHGAEVSRVEDTIRRLCRAYGCIRSDVFTITSSIIVTAVSPGEYAVTQTRRIRERDTDLGTVEKVNALARSVCGEPVSAAILRQEIQLIREAKKAPWYLNLAMYMMISASLSVFFGGTWMDGLAASLSGMVLYAALYGSSVLKLNSIIQTMACSALTALSVMLLLRLGIGSHPDKIMIGNIMLVIPGIQLTTSIRDMINGDMISGLLNMSEALLKAISVAMGFAIIVIMGG